MKNLALLGFTAGENRYSYPEVTADKAEQFFLALRDIAEYTVVDCTCDENDIISGAAKRECDRALLLLAPDIKSTVNYTSCINRFLVIKEKKITVVNNNVGIFASAPETGRVTGDEKIYKLPYTLELVKQAVTGKLTERLFDRSYRNEMSKIVRAVL